MLIGVVSDSHDHEPHIQQAVNIFKDRGVDLIIHAGDYCSPFTIPHFEGLPLHGILGNNDGDCYLLMQKFNTIDAHLHGTFFERNIDDCSLAVITEPINQSQMLCERAGNMTSS